jgi:hypothetical protein
MADAPLLKDLVDRESVSGIAAAIGDGPQPVVVDYAVVFQNASGTGSRKVFKGAVDELAAGSTLAFRRKISVQPMSTRQIFAGPHLVEAQVNGVVYATTGFDVVE